MFQIRAFRGIYTCWWFLAPPQYDEQSFVCGSQSIMTWLLLWTVDNLLLRKNTLWKLFYFFYFQCSEQHNQNHVHLHWVEAKPQRRLQLKTWTNPTKPRVDTTRAESKKKEKWVHRPFEAHNPTTEQIFQHLYEENLEVPGIKALLSTGVAEALLVATGLAGVGARALWLLLDGDWRAVKCHRYRRQQTEKRVGKHTHTESRICIFFSHLALPRYYSC